MILLQHSELGEDDDAIAPAQGLSSVGLQVTASETLASTSKSSISTAQIALHEDAFIVAS